MARKGHKKDWTPSNLVIEARKESITYIEELLRRNKCGKRLLMGDH